MLSFLFVFSLLAAIITLVILHLLVSMTIISCPNQLKQMATHFESGSAGVKNPVKSL